MTSDQLQNVPRFITQVVIINIFASQTFSIFLPGCTVWSTQICLMPRYNKDGLCSGRHLACKKTRQINTENYRYPDIYAAKLQQSILLWCNQHHSENNKLSIDRSINMLACVIYACIGYVSLVKKWTKTN